MIFHCVKNMGIWTIEPIRYPSILWSFQVILGWFQIQYIFVTVNDHVLQAEKSKAKKSNVITLEELKTGGFKRLKAMQMNSTRTTKPGYMKLVNQVFRLNGTRLKQQRTITSQNKTIFRQDFQIKRLENEIRRQKDKIRAYKAQLRSFNAKLKDKGKT